MLFFAYIDSSKVMHHMNASAQPQVIRWGAIASLIFLDLAILISWMAYHEYQPALLTLFKFTEFTVPLAILQGVILFLTPPIAGLAADRMIKRGGNRLPVVTIGINFVSMVFMVVAVTVFAEPGGLIRLLFPVMVALWLIAMNIFHSPAISTVETFVPESRMPIVVALFVILANLVEALEPVLLDLIHFFGGPLTFAVGGILVFVSGTIFARVSKSIVAQQDAIAGAPVTERKSNFPLVFVLGVVVGAATTVFFKLFPNWLNDSAVPAVIFPELKATWGEIWAGAAGVTNGTHYSAVFTSVLIAVAALLSLPMGFLAAKMGPRRIAIASALMMISIICSLQYSHGTPALILYCLFPIAFAAASVTFLPIAFANLEKRHLVFGIGIFFSGVELLSSIVDVINVL